MIWEAIVFSVLILIAAGGGFALGHLFTMRSIAHIQPSASSMPVSDSVSYEPDQFADDYDDDAPTVKGEEGREDMMSKMKGMGLDVSEMRATMSGKPMVMAGAKATTSFIPEPGPGYDTSAQAVETDTYTLEEEAEEEPESEPEIKEDPSGDEA